MSFAEKIFVSIIVVTILFLLLVEIKKRKHGAKMEERVANILKTLPGNFVVIKNVVVGLGDVDLVVVGPTGVWAIEVKGQDAGYIKSESPRFKKAIKQTSYGAVSLHGFLKDKLGKEFFVQPLLVYPGERIVLADGLVRENGVQVKTTKNIRDCIQEVKTQSLNGSTVEHIARVLSFKK